jgi:pre-mRNA-splicing factor CWC26
LGRVTEGGDLSPTRKGWKFASHDLSPLCKERDLSPPSKRGRKEEAPKEVRKAGLMTVEEVKEDIRKIKEDEKLKWVELHILLYRCLLLVVLDLSCSMFNFHSSIRFTALDPSLVGKGAKAVFRAKEGMMYTVIMASILLFTS